MRSAYPRDLAVRVLTRVLSKSQPLDAALDNEAGREAQATRAWLQEVCSGTLRWKGRLDLALDSVALRKKPSGWLRKMLLIAAYQLTVQERIQPPKVIFETVEEIKRREGDAPARFANACLRKLSEHATSWRTMPFPGNGALKPAAAWASLPEWLWKRLVDQQGEVWATRFALASLERPSLWLRSREEGWNPDWAERGPVPCSWKAIQGGDITAKPGFETAEFVVQDISSQVLLSEVAAIVRQELGTGLSAFDLCAAPGGKSIGLHWHGFQVTASDQEGPRLALLGENLRRVAPDIRVIFPKETAALPNQGLVWVDAPCTGTGIIRRHPDVRWLRQEKDIASLSRIQSELLRTAWSKTKSGGFLAYSVCSILAEEGPEAIRHAELEPHRIRSWFLAPQEAPFGDGFWAALIRKP